MVARRPLSGQEETLRKPTFSRHELNADARALARRVDVKSTSSLITVESDACYAGRRYAEAKVSHPPGGLKQSYMWQCPARAATAVYGAISRGLQAAFAGPLSTLFPRAHIVPAVNREWLCRDPGYFEDFDNDPLTTDTRKVTARMGSETLRAMRALATNPHIAHPDSAFSKIPALFLIGSADRVVCQRQGARFFDRLASRDKHIKVFHGLYHCLLEDPEKDDVIRYLTQWLAKRFPKQGITKVAMFFLCDVPGSPRDSLMVLVTTHKPEGYVPASRFMRTKCSRSIGAGGDRCWRVRLTVPPSFAAARAPRLRCPRVVESSVHLSSNLSESVWFPGTTRHSSLSKPCVARASAGMDSSPARHLPPSDSTPDSKASSTPDGKSIVLLTPDKASGKTKRKTKRLVWTDELHFRFVSAVFELGVKNASPKALLANPTEGLTAEHIKSHLQKYRINYERSRLETQKLNEKHAKRTMDVRGGSDSNPTTGHKPQWNTCDALLLEGEASEQHMHWTMQQRMDFHRELLLTRSVEFTAGSSWATRMDNVYTSGATNARAASNDGNYYEQGEQDKCDSSFLQAWASAEQLRQQEARVYGRLHQQQQSLFSQQPLFTQDAMPVTPISVRNDHVAAQPPPPPDVDAQENTDAVDGMDLASWGRLSLTVDPDDDDIFGFLRSTNDTLEQPTVHVYPVYGRMCRLQWVFFVVEMSRNAATNLAQTLSMIVTASSLGRGSSYGNPSKIAILAQALSASTRICASGSGIVDLHFRSAPHVNYLSSSFPPGA
ncbi:hypothetical protein ON010_g7750 [Phytophthora cinnamomi]|nr:hypothetical protein ON010_g7750 [Phytophthora cinnamomi]